MTGFTIELEEGQIDKRGLPIIVIDSFDMIPISINGKSFVLMVPASGIEFTGSLFVKRIYMVEQTLKTPCLLLLGDINSDVRRTLTNNQVNFVVSDRQLNLPSMLLFLTERGINKKKQQLVLLSPAAQLIIFYHLLYESLDGLKLMEISQRVAYTLKTVSSAVSELVMADVCEVTQPDKRTKIVRFPNSRKAIWSRLQSKMTSPILHSFYIDSELLLKDTPLYYSYDSALCRSTMIANPTQESYAIEKSNPLIKLLQERGELRVGEGHVKLEIWKYPPSFLATDGVVDPLSLWMCYREEDDERVDGELGRLINKRLED